MHSPEETIPDREDTGAVTLSRTGLLVSILAFLWVLEAVDQWFLDASLDRYGVRPRSAGGLLGVLFAPALHAGFGHLLSNSVPFFVLGWFVMVRTIGEFVEVTAIVWLLGGFGTWLIGGAGTVHVGASILVFGYLGYLFSRAFFLRSIGTLLVAAIVAFLYGGLIWGILPIERSVSWQGHISGLLAGAAAAWLLARFGNDPAS